MWRELITNAPIFSELTAFRRLWNSSVSPSLIATLVSRRSPAPSGTCLWTGLRAAGNSEDICDIAAKISIEGICHWSCLQWQLHPIRVPADVFHIRREAASSCDSKWLGYQVGLNACLLLFLVNWGIFVGTRLGEVCFRLQGNLIPKRLLPLPNSFLAKSNIPSIRDQILPFSLRPQCLDAAME